MPASIPIMPSSNVRSSIVGTLRCIASVRTVEGEEEESAPGVQHANPAHMHDQYVVQYANSPYELYAEFGIN